MATVADVAAYVLEQYGSMTAMKLQKLCYYAQAWSLVWEERPLFDEKVEAWANGPVVPDLYQLHRGQFRVEPGDIDGDPAGLDSDNQETIDAVLTFYGPHEAHWLSELTHREPPWVNARANERLNEFERGNVEITPAAMAEYYDSLTFADEN